MKSEHTRSCWALKPTKMIQTHILEGVPHGQKSSTKPSSYTKDFQRKHPKAKTLKNKSISTGVPYHVIKKVYDKGVAAWRTGHRVGATPEQWGYARVHSFLTLGCTAMSSDSKLLKLATSRMAPKHRNALLAQNIKCPKTKLKTKYYRKFDMPAG